MAQETGDGTEPYAGHAKPGDEAKHLIELGDVDLVEQAPPRGGVLVPFGGLGQVAVRGGQDDLHWGHCSKVGNLSRSSRRYDAARSFSNPGDRDTTGQSAAWYHHQYA
jgi:hypothetical protein